MGLGFSARFCVCFFKQARSVIVTEPMNTTYQQAKMALRGEAVGGQGGRRGSRRRLPGSVLEGLRLPPPKELEPKRAGPEAPLARATAAAGARLPPSVAPPATVPQAFGEGRERMGVSPHLGPFLVVVVVSGNFIKSVSRFLGLPLPEEPELPPRSE